jgi:mono/diheme cytochrome c family protein
LLPVGRATDLEFGAVVSLVDLASMNKRTDIALPNGSSAVRGVAVGPDSRWAYVVHTVGRYNVPTTQVARGWVNTNALSVIDLANGTHHATVLLDHPTHGAADPWGLAISDDGRWLCVTLSGTHELGRVDLAALWKLLETGDRAALLNDLSGLHRTSVIRRIPIDGKGPRGVALSPDGKMAAVAVYFSGQVALIDTASGKTTMGPLGEQPAVDPVRMGERVFHDGTRSFQDWLSCATCHPDGRVDGLNWDLLNDGLGNPKNAKSMVWSHRTPPVMSRGVRDKMETAAKAGFTHIQFTTPSDEELAATIAYIKSLQPLASPYRNVDGSLTEAAKRGEAIFRRPTTRCANCHPPPLLTDLKLHNVGTRQEMDQSDLFDTPSLIELWRTAPYLHDGGAADLRELLIDRNPKNRHGRTSHLSSQEIDDLIEYLLSL